MKKFLVILLLLFFAISFAQDRFIEVEVGDTITLRPERFEYVIKIYIPDTYAASANEDYNYDLKTEKKKYAQKSEELKKFLKKNKYTFSPIDEETGLGDWTFYTDSGVIVDLKDMQELQKLRKVLEKLDYISGSIGDAIFANEETAEDDLFMKLICKAKAKAVVIAVASGIKAGDILSIKEVEAVTAPDFNIGDTYFVADHSKKLKIRNGKLVGSLYKSIVVKFAAE